MESTHNASCTIAVEGTNTKLYRSGKSHPDGDDSFLHLLIPILQRFRQDTPIHDGGKCLGFVTAALATADMGFALNKASFLKGDRGSILLKATYHQTPTVSYSLDSSWKPSRYIYIVRSTGHVEVHDGSALLHEGSPSLETISPATARFIVTPGPTVHAIEGAKTLN